MLGETIAAIGTALGEAGIGIVRLSGDNALEIIKRVFVPLDRARFEHGIGYHLYYGHILEPDVQTIVDEVLVSIMRSPHSYTGEDVVEINCHGGVVAQQIILNLVLSSGARLALPGEFTKRAFINGRLDLAQAEAIIDLIRAKTSLSAASAVEQLRGRLSTAIQECRNILLGVLAHIEAGIDFPEDDIVLNEDTVFMAELENVRVQLQGILSTAERGKILRDGLNTAIVGQPNVGKSSLLNALLREEKAIVTDIPGTTRDVLAEYISVRGIPLKLMDTAGIRDTVDSIEKIGIERALGALRSADLVLFVIEAGRNLSARERELLLAIPQDSLIIVINKIDVAEPMELDFDVPVYFISALKNEGIAQLEDGIVNLATGRSWGESPIVSNTRHISTIEKAAGRVNEAIYLISSGVPLDLVSIDIRAAHQFLGEISGETVSEDLLDEIFSRFCIGK
ncbi:MAG: tRNA uridine-5-carboxymethylaminomethyl(34) synthesis GTPase MnmE [Peptococcaceae bacterium]|nr:tRNA uridine-5-carboxymethylaminomethyl(34) synthesis GTPase MnmE [Peptococcaceae bacterium]